MKLNEYLNRRNTWKKSSFNKSQRPLQKMRSVKEGKYDPYDDEDFDQSLSITHGDDEFDEDEYEDDYDDEGEDFPDENNDFEYEDEDDDDSLPDEDWDSEEDWDSPSDVSSIAQHDFGIRPRNYNESRKRWLKRFFEESEDFDENEDFAGTPSDYDEYDENDDDNVDNYDEDESFDRDYLSNKGNYNDTDFEDEEDADFEGTDSLDDNSDNDFGYDFSSENPSSFDDDENDYQDYEFENDEDDDSFVLKPSTIAGKTRNFERKNNSLTRRSKRTYEGKKKV